MRMYDELAAWFHMLSDPSDYAEEVATYLELIDAAHPDAGTLLELGSGGGNAASYLRERFTCTLTDISPQMLRLSRTINPGCEHIQGDMRTLRLERTFDVVFVHDAVVYMTTPEDLAAAIETAYVHTSPGGVAMFVPDATRESFVAGTDHGGGDGHGGRAIRYLEWSHEPEPGASTHVVDYVLVVRERDGTVTSTHDRHIEGLFPQEVWRTLLIAHGFSVTEPQVNPLIHGSQAVFLCRRPG